MIPLIDTAIGFVAVMLVLSFLVKSLTSIVKNHLDFYSHNLRYETSRLFEDLTKKTLAELEQEHEALKGIDWKRAGEEFLTADNINWIASKLNPNPLVAAYVSAEELEKRILVHAKRVQYAFDVRMKNVAMALGVGLCLFLDVNAFTIWKTLYNDPEIREKFATEYAEYALQIANAEETGPGKGEGAQGAERDQDQEKGEGDDQEGEPEDEARLRDAATTAEATSSPEDAPLPSSAPEKTDAGAPETEGAIPPAQKTAVAGAGTREPDEDLPDPTELERRRREYVRLLNEFSADVSFGVGAIWMESPAAIAREAAAEAAKADAELMRARKAKRADLDVIKKKAKAANSRSKRAAAAAEAAPPPPVDDLGAAFREFLGALFTGVLVSVGAPYWHDLLRSLTALRNKKDAEATEETAKNIKKA